MNLLHGCENKLDNTKFTSCHVESFEFTACVWKQTGQYKIYKLSFCKSCIYTHPVNSKFTIREKTWLKSTFNWLNKMVTIWSEVYYSLSCLNYCRYGVKLSDRINQTISIINCGTIIVKRERVRELLTYSPVFIPTNV